MPYLLLAHGVLALHVLLLIFIVGVPFGILAVHWAHRKGGPALRRSAVAAFFDSRRVRMLHLVAIAVVVAESWFGIPCPLTVLEMALRDRAGAARYRGDFIGHWLQTLLYYDAPAWVFAAAYTGFAVLVAAVWWRFPPRR